MTLKKTAGQPFSMGFKKSFPEAPYLRPALNIGCLMDIPTGNYYEGPHGEMLHSGGMAHVTGIGGRGNSYKSTFAHHQTLTALDRYISCEAMAHDTEYSQSYPRWQSLANNMPRLRELDMSNVESFMISSQGDMMGNVWFKELKDHFKAKNAARKETMSTTPFLDPRTNKPIKILIPSLVEIDSLSALKTDVVEEILDKNEIGAGAANTVHMRSAGAKSQLVMQLPDIAEQNGGYLVFTAHMGDDIQMDPYAAPQKKLAFLKNKLKFKQVPENVSFLTSNLWMITGSVVEATRDKVVTYPIDSSDNRENDTDLQRIMVVNLRGKQGPSGMPFEIILSQRAGVLPYLSEYHFLKGHGRYGLGGTDKDYFLDIHPDEKLTRTTIRGVCAKDLLVQRAMTITSEMLQIKLMMPDFRHLMVSPKDLYKGLIEKGFDWAKLLDTRGYWVFKEDEDQHKPFLSTLDLLRMNAGLYTPYWK